MPPPTTPAAPPVDNFTMDDKAWLRAFVVLISIGVIVGILVFIRCYRAKNRSRVRRYDLLSAKQLAPQLVLNSDDSEDDLFVQDDRRQLVPPEPVAASPSPNP
uniref:DAG1 domain-containing protein n=1 Tax=Steinernema glaseri TaxID=37863 RepID=A0A1I7YHY4_9BILA